MIYVFPKLVVVFSVTFVIKAAPIGEKLPSFCETLKFFLKGNDSFDVLQKGNPDYAAFKSCAEFKHPPQPNEELSEEHIHQSALCQEIMLLGSQKCQINPSLVVRTVDITDRDSACATYQTVLHSMPDLKFINITSQDGVLPSVVMTEIKSQQIDRYSKRPKCDFLCLPEIAMPICHLAVSLYVTPDESVVGAVGGPQQAAEGIDQSVVPQQIGDGSDQPPDDGGDLSHAPVVDTEANMDQTDGTDNNKDTNTNKEPLDNDGMSPQSEETKAKAPNPEHASESAKIPGTPTVKPVTGNNLHAGPVASSNHIDSSSSKPVSHGGSSNPKESESGSPQTLNHGLPEVPNTAEQKPNLSDNQASTQQNSQTLQHLNTDVVGPKIEGMDHKNDGKDAKNDDKDTKNDDKDTKNDDKDPKDEHKDPKDALKDPKDALKDPKDALKDSKDEHKDPKNDGKDIKNDGKDPKNDGKDPKNDGKDPKNDGNNPKNDDKDPKNDDKDPRNDDKDPKNDDKDPKNDDKDPKKKVMEGTATAKGLASNTDSSQADKEANVGGKPEKPVDQDIDAGDPNESTQPVSGDAPNEAAPPIQKDETSDQNAGKDEDSISAPKNTNNKNDKPGDAPEDAEEPQEDANRDAGNRKLDLDMADNNGAPPDGNDVLEKLNQQPPSINGFPAQEDSHFFAYFLTIIIIIILAYLVIHNKQKILGLIVEGRGSQRRRSHSYRKLDTESSKGSQMIF